MIDLNFNKEQLVNLKESLNVELLGANVGNAYACTTLCCCNTRKYHGLLIVPQPDVDKENHVLLSSLDETLISRNTEFHLGIHRYPHETYSPKGHKYLHSFEAYPVSKHTYCVGGIVFSKEMLFLGKENCLVIRYVLKEAKQSVVLRLSPFLAFRQIHRLSKANEEVNTEFRKIDNGIRMQLYPGYTPIYMQFSKKVNYVHNPDWYYNIEYIKEQERGYDFQEDLLVPGCFEMPIKVREPIYFAAGVEPVNPFTLSRKFSLEIKTREPLNSLENCLSTAAQHFIVKHGKKAEIVAGFPWFGAWGRDTFIALPGLTLMRNDLRTCKQVLDTMISTMQGPLFPNIGANGSAAYNSMDASLWFFYALWQYAEISETQDNIWEEYGEVMKQILNGYRNGTKFNIHATPDGLLWGGEEGKALTWMDAIVGNAPVTPRRGMPVEVNCLWYNAIMFSLDMARIAQDVDFIDLWEPYVADFPNTFKKNFWSKEFGWLADVTDGDYKDFSIRPNMIFAVSLPYSPVSEKIQQLIVETVQRELLTPRGLRTLSPGHPDYKGTCFGTQTERDLAYHQGTAWPWLLGAFCEAYLRVYKQQGVALVRNIYQEFENTLREDGLGCISEIYDGNPPHTGRGCISQAWSVGELLRIKHLMEGANKGIYPGKKRP